MRRTTAERTADRERLLVLVAERGTLTAVEAERLTGSPHAAADLHRLFVDGLVNRSIRMRYDHQRTNLFGGAGVMRRREATYTVSS